MYSGREVRITSGCPCRKAWGRKAIVLQEHILNGAKHLLVDIEGNWLLVKEVLTKEYDGLSEARASKVSL
jgi:hypothetical protein